MEREELRGKIEEIAEQTLGVRLSEEESLKECGVDSLGLVAVVVGIEEEFGFSFCDSDLQPENLQTLADLIELAGKYV